MGADNSNVRRNSLFAAVFFAIVCVIYGFRFIKGLETSTTGNHVLRGILAALFGVISVMNFLKYKRAKG